jgi:hypothetical protein
MNTLPSIELIDSKYVPKEVVILYKNHRGVTAIRRIRPAVFCPIWYGKTEWHSEQWLLDTFDCDKKMERSFAIKDILAEYTLSRMCSKTYCRA